MEDCATAGLTLGDLGIYAALAVVGFLAGISLVWKVLDWIRAARTKEVIVRDRENPRQLPGWTGPAFFTLLVVGVVVGVFGILYAIL